MRTNTKRWQKSRQRRHRRLFNRKQLPLRRALLPLPIRQGPPLEQESPLKAEIHKKIKKLTKEELILPKKKKDDNSGPNWRIGKFHDDNDDNQYHTEQAEVEDTMAS